MVISGVSVLGTNISPPSPSTTYLPAGATTSPKNAQPSPFRFKQSKGTLSEQRQDNRRLESLPHLFRRGRSHSGHPGHSDTGGVPDYVSILGPPELIIDVLDLFDFAPISATASLFCQNTVNTPQGSLYYLDNSHIKFCQSIISLTCSKKT